MKRVSDFIYPLLFGVILIALLQLKIIHAVFNIKTLQLPLPYDIFKAFVLNAKDFVPHIYVTIIPAICGLLIGAALGYIYAVFVTLFKNAGFGFLFLVTLINSIPVVALAPLMNRWFPGSFMPKIIVIILAASGIMAQNAYMGLNNISKSMVDLMKTYGAGRFETLGKIQIPNSLPNVFSALKLGVSSTMLATIISEFFASDTKGLGYMIKYTLKVGNQKHIGWAYILVVSILSITLYLLVYCLERRILSWHVSQKRLK